MWRRFGWMVLFLASGVLAACGGGSGSSGSTGSNLSNITKNGTFSLGFSGGSVPGVRHAWLTAYKIAFNEDANRPWDPNDSTWKVVTLSTPVTFDAASAGGFIVGSAAGGVIVPAGTYNQIRLFLSPFDDTSSLPTVTDEAGGKTLTFKAQLDYDSGAAIPSVPIEIPNLNTGIRLDRGVVVNPNSWSYLVVHMDLDRSMVRFDGDYGAVDAITLRPRTFTYGISSAAGTIQGNIDPKYICGTSAYAASGATSCVSNITVSAYAPERCPYSYTDAQCQSFVPRRMENWQTVRVNPKALNITSDDDGSFVLGPFSPAGGNPSQFDVVIRGQGMKPMLFKDVAYVPLAPTILGCLWSVAADSNSTTGQTVIQPIMDPGVARSVTLSPAQIMAQRVGLGFSLAGGPVYELFNGNTDPFTGALVPDAALSLPSDSGSHVMTVDYQTGVVDRCPTRHLATDSLALNDYVTFTDNALSGYQAYALGTFYTSPTLASAQYTSGTTFAVDPPTPITGNVGSVSVTLNGFDALPGGINKAELIASDVGGIVKTMDVSACVGSTPLSPCPTQFMTLPAGTSANGAAAGVYEFAVRYWNSSAPQSAVVPGGTMKWARSSTFVNLRSASTGAVSITAP